VCLAIPGRILELRAGGHLALADISGVRRTVNIDLLRNEGIAPGDWALIHVGFAMSRIGAERAAEQLRLLSALGEDDAARDEVEGYTFGDRDPPDDV
jgi:hydrogenase expression/formation protein HypC